MRTVLAAALFVLTLLPSGATAAVQAPPLAEPAAKRAPGLALTVAAGGKTDVRTARLVTLYVPAGQPVTPFVPAGPFSATWEGDISSPLRAEYSMHAEVRGSFKLTVNGKLLLEGAGDAAVQSVSKAVQLNKGLNKLVAEFAADGKEDALVRLNWSAKDFPVEPVPPGVFSHAPSAAEGGAARVRHGRMLFAQLRCAACHGDAELIPAKGTGMPELAHDAPVFDELGAKFNEAWLAHWISDPHSIRPGTLMPRIFHGAEGKVDQRAADLAAYFIAQGKRDETAPAEENAPLGGALFANLGCVGCHTPPSAQGEDEHQRVPLSHLKAKWQPRALREYLKAPEARYAWTHMPNFKLTDEEAERLTAYLLSGAQREFPAGPAGDAAKGGQLLVSAGCLNCHAGLPPTTQPTLAATLQGGWTKGCMAPDADTRGQAPDFVFTKEQRDALLAFGASGLGSLKQDAPAEFAERQVKTLRCTACHARDLEPSTWSQLEGEMVVLQSAAPTTETVEGAPVAGTSVPILTWLGEKLKAPWAEQFIAGKIAEKPRPWLIARMPAFTSRAAGLAAGLAFEHGFPVGLEEEPAVDTARAKAGETLLGEQGGFNCTQCHAAGEKGATAVFEAPGPNFALTHERLRKEYYHRWVMHPLRVDPDTKMPRFADDDGKTPLTDFFEGDARTQFDAIWQYLRTLRK